MKFEKTTKIPDNLRPLLESLGICLAQLEEALISREVICNG